MNRLNRTRVTAVALAAPALLLAAGCSDDKKDDAAGVTTVTVVATDAGCAPTPTSVASGSITFKADSQTDKIKEVELIQGSKILGETENLEKGKSGQFTLRLDGGAYTIFCPGGETSRTAFTVTGGDSSAAPQDESAGAAYKAYVDSEVAKLLPAAQAFVDAIKANDLEKAKSLFASARYHYETIEPVAESFGDLDPKIDNREDGLEPGEKWTGFHRIEQQMWVKKNLDGMAELADQLIVDINDLKKKVDGETYKAGQIANGAVELLQEVGTSKITGEEDRYSHTDLSDFEANVEGAEQAYLTVKVALQSKDKDLAEKIDAAFIAVKDSIKPYKTGDTYVDYSTVTEAQRKALTDVLNSLAEPMSKVAALVA